MALDSDNQGAPAHLDDTPVLDDVPGVGLPDAPPSPEPQASPAPEPASQASKQQSYTVPIRELLDEREERQRLKARLDEYERRDKELAKAKAEDSPDAYWRDPTAFTREEVQQGIASFQQQAEQRWERLQQQLLFNSRRVAEQEFGKEEVAEAENAFNEAARSGRLHPAEHARINESLNPYLAAVEWRKQQRTLAEIGTDPDAYRQKLRQELLKDPEFVSQAAQIAREMAAGNVSFRPAQPAQPSPQPAQRKLLPDMRTVGAAAPTGGRLSDQSGDDLLDEVFSAA